MTLSYSKLKEIINDLKGRTIKPPPELDNDDELCDNCGQRQKSVVNSIYHVCTNCGDCVQKNCHVASIDDMKHTKKSVYKRASYFESLLNRLQGKSFTKIEPELLASIKSENPKNVSAIRAVLKKMNLAEYYKFAPYILTLVKGNTTLITPLTANETATIKSMFDDLQEKYERIKPNNVRSNFPNYNFVMYQLLNEIGRNDLCVLLSLPKNKTIILKHLTLWQQMAVLL